MSISALRRNSTAAAAKIAEHMKSAGNKGNKDESLWKLFLDDEQGVGQAEIRFMPAPEGEELPFVLIYDHGFKNEANGKYYIENSLSTPGINKRDAIGKLNQRLWATGIESNKKIASEHKRRTNYFANILVVRDPARPENEGKVFRYRFGPVIYEMIEQQMAPKFEGDASINPFNLWEGTNLKLRARRDGPKNKGFWKYDQSKWDAPSEVFPGDDNAKEVIWKQCSSLQALVHPSKFKSEAELAAKLLEVLGPRCGTLETIEGGAEIVAAPAQEYQRSQPVVASQVTTHVAQRETPSTVPAATSSVDADDDLDFFTKAANGTL